MQLIPTETAKAMLLRYIDEHPEVSYVAVAKHFGCSRKHVTMTARKAGKPDRRKLTKMKNVGELMQEEVK